MRFQEIGRKTGGHLMKKLIVLVIVTALISTAWAIRNEYSDRINELSKEILMSADELKDATEAPVFHSLEVERILSELKDSIKEYENLMVFAESPYPGEILLGTTPGGDDTWLETLCDSRYNGLIKEIRIRRTGNRARYLRINDIEITNITPRGPSVEIFNKSARFRLYQNEVFKLALPKPMKIGRIRIMIEHESTGLQIYGLPYILPVIKPQVRRDRLSGETLLGTTPAGKDTWLETLCSSPYNRPVREIHLKRTGRESDYLRINDIELTYMTPQGPKKEVFNNGARYRLYYDGIFKLVLPRPMRVVRIRVLIAHESAGLNVYGIY
jgi:hypothetical protein